MISIPVRCGFLLVCIYLLTATSAFSFDWHHEGRARLDAFFLTDPPLGLTHQTNQTELRNTILATLIEKEAWVLDTEVSFDLRRNGGWLVDSGLEDDFDPDFFRAWLRYDRENFKLRAGRQQILFGAATLYRPLGLFDTRVISGIIPLTRGVDAVRSTVFFDNGLTLEGWGVPTKKEDTWIAGIRGEWQLSGVEVGMVFQRHPETELDFLTDHELDLVQWGFHIKGEYHLGLWNETRFDFDSGNPDNFRLSSTFGADYTFDVGQGLHVLIEYFLSSQSEGFRNLDNKQATTINQLGVLLDLPVGTQIVLRNFMFFDLNDRSFQILPQIEYAMTDSIFLFFQAQIGGSVDGDNSNGRLFRQNAFLTGTESRFGFAAVAYF